MAESSVLAIALDRAYSVFCSLNNFGDGVEHGIVREGNCELLFDDLGEKLSELQDAIQEPPDGFAEVAAKLKGLDAIIQVPRDGEQRSSRSQFEDCALASADVESGFLAIREAMMRCPESLAAHPDRFFTSLDRYPATTCGNLGFLEDVLDEVRYAIEAKQQRLEREYSKETLNKMVDGVKWSEARLRITLLGQLPQKIVKPVADILRRELTVGTIEQIDELLGPAVGGLRNAYERVHHDWDANADHGTKEDVEASSDDSADQSRGKADNHRSQTVSSQKETRQDRLVVSDEGTVADLDVAILASGDDPERIPEWGEIRHFLRQRFGEDRSDADLWERFTDWLTAAHRLSPEDYLPLPLNHIRNLLTAEKKSKRSTVKNEARDKLVSALTDHHKYANGGCLNLEPIGNNELARKADVSQGSASQFFKKQFGGHPKYKRLCQDPKKLVAALKLLNQEYSPMLLYGADPHGEDNQDDE